eukprot:577926-Pelagomonas_calceolata.AAC.5
MQLRSAPCATNREDVRGLCLKCACSWTQLRDAPRTSTHWDVVAPCSTVLAHRCSCAGHYAQPHARMMQLRSAPYATNREDVRGLCLDCTCSWTQPCPSVPAVCAPVCVHE